MTRRAAGWLPAARHGTPLRAARARRPVGGVIMRPEPGRGQPRLAGPRLAGMKGHGNGDHVTGQHGRGTPGDDQRAAPVPLHRGPDASHAAPRLSRGKRGRQASPRAELSALSSLAKARPPLL